VKLCGFPPRGQARLGLDAGDTALADFENAMFAGYETEVGVVDLAFGEPHVAKLRIGDHQAGHPAVAELDDGSERVVDHVIAGTGYRIDISRYPFLAPELVAQVLRAAGFPKLSRAYESSVEGLYFVGAPAAASMGPGMRFVSHSGMAGAAVARHARGRT